MPLMKKAANPVRIHNNNKNNNPSIILYDNVISVVPDEMLHNILFKIPLNYSGAPLK